MVEKNPAAVALGKLRAATLTQEHQQAASAARMDRISPERRKEIATKASRAAAAKRKSLRRKKKKLVEKT